MNIMPSHPFMFMLKLMRKKLLVKLIAGVIHKWQQFELHNLGICFPEKKKPRYLQNSACIVLKIRIATISLIEIFWKD